MDGIVICRRHFHSSFIVIYNHLIVLYDYIFMILNYNPINFSLKNPSIRYLRNLPQYT
jgi:hypothetical protein